MKNEIARKENRVASHVRDEHMVKLQVGNSVHGARAAAATSQFKHTLVGQFYGASTRVDVMPKIFRRDSRTSLNVVNRWDRRA